MVVALMLGREGSEGFPGKKYPPGFRSSDDELPALGRKISKASGRDLRVHRLR